VIETAQTARHKSLNSWRFPGSQGFAATLIQAVQEAFTLILVLVAKSLPPSSRLFHKANKVRKRRGVWRNALQPIIQSTHVHSRCGHDVVQMRPRLSKVARAAQPHTTHPLGMDAFYACPPGVFLLKRFRLLALTSGI
jgi:hypothetical protein